MTFKKYDFISRITPNVEYSEGVRPAELFIPADYLPLVRFDKKIQDYKVISAGKVVAVDSNNRVVPAGLLKDIQAAIAAGDVNSTSVVNEYTQTDVDEGVRNAAGNLVAAGEKVIASFFPSDDTQVANGIGTAGSARITVSKPLGIAPYDYFRWNGSSDGNPMEYTYMNYNMQHGVAILTRYYIEMPVVSGITNVSFPGMAVFVGDPKPGDLVTYDANSNFVVASDIAVSADATTGAAIAADLETTLNQREGTVIGRIYFVDANWPKDYLDRVKTFDVDGFTTLDKVPGSATDGYPDAMTYSGADQEATPKMVRINLLV